MVYMVMSLSSEDCSALIRDNYIQRTLQTFEEEEEELDERSHTENILKYLDDMCGWIPDPSIQYRRQPNDKTKGKTSKPDWGSLSRRTGRHDNQQQVIDYDFKHYTNLRKYIEQYRRFHTCGGPLEKLSQSAYGRTKTVYYTNGNDQADTSTSKSAERRSDSGSRSKPCSKHLSDAPKGSLIKYHDDIPSSPPKYQSLTDVVLRKRSEAAHNLGNYTNNGWSNVPPGVVSGEAPPQKTTLSNKDAPMQWTINEHGLTIYHQDKSSTVFRHKGSSQHDLSPDTNQFSKYPAGSYQPQTSFLPFFTPTQHATGALASGGLQSKNRQLSPPTVPAPTLPISSGFSIDRTINNSRSSTTGATHDQDSLLQDLYSQLVHAAVNLQLKKSMELRLKPLPDYHFMQKHLNLSPLRQKSKSYDDSASTCSSHGSKKRGRSKVKGRNTPSKVKGRNTPTKVNNKSLVQEHHSIKSAPPIERQGHAKVKSHQVSAEQQRSADSASSSKTLPMTSSASHDVGLHNSVTRYLLGSDTNTGGDGHPTKCASSYRVRFDDFQRPMEIDKKVALCEATWF